MHDGRRDICLPELSVLGSHCIYEGLALGNELVWGEAIELEAALRGVGEVLVVGDVAEEACRDAKRQIVSAWVPLGQKVVFGKAEPRCER